jgi:hypothetical protein
MFFHKFRKDLVLALELLLQEGDPPILGIAGPSGAGLEDGRAVLEELLLPAVEHGGVDAVLVTQVRDGDVFEEMEPQDGDLLLSGELLARLLGHGRASARDCSLFERSVFPIPSEAGQAAVPRSFDPRPGSYGRSGRGSNMARGITAGGRSRPLGGSAAIGRLRPGSLNCSSGSKEED